MYCNDVITKNLCLIISTLSAVQFHRDKKTQKKQKWRLILKRSANKRSQACNHQNTPKNATYDDYSLRPKKVYLLDTDSNNNSSIFLNVSYIIQKNAQYLYVSDTF